MKIVRFGLLLMLAGMLTASAWAHVYVKNKIFQGGTAGSGSSTLVEVKPMLEALGVSEYRLEGGQLVVGESTLALEGEMVSLKALVDALGARILLNPELGTIDVYQGGDKPIALAEESAPSKVAQPGYEPTYAKQGVWLTSWDEATRESQRRNKPILINFTGSDWCGWCIRLKEEVFSTEPFKAWASKEVVLFEADFPRQTPLAENLQAQNQQLAQKFGIRGYPSIVFSDSKGNEIGSRYGYDEGGPAVWIKGAEARIAEGAR